MSSLGGRRKWRNRVLGGAAGVLVMLGASSGVYLTTDAAGGSALLKLLSPPGAGYDSTNIALTTGSGGAVAFTRASTWTCQDTSGAIRSLSSNKPCVVDGQSLRVRSAVARLNSHPTALENAAWVDIGTPILTTETWDFGAGLIGETIQDDDAAVLEGKQQTYVTAATGAYTGSVWLRGVGSMTSALLRVTVTGGTGSLTCSITGLSTTTATRATCSTTAGAGVSDVRLDVRVGTVASDVGSIQAGGMQLAASSQPGDLCLVGPTLQNQTCAAETATVATPAGLSRTEGAAKVCITPSWTGANPSGAQHTFLHTGGTGLFAYNNSGSANIHAFDGTSTASVAADYVSGVRKCYRTVWSAAQNLLRIENQAAGTSASAAGFTTFPAFGATLGIGSSTAGTVQGNASLDSICLSKSPNGCQ